MSKETIEILEKIKAELKDSYIGEANYDSALNFARRIINKYLKEVENDNRRSTEK